MSQNSEAGPSMVNEDSGVEEDANRAGERPRAQAVAVETKELPVSALPVATDLFGSNESFAALVVSVILSVYYHTLQPSVPGGDAGELITEAYQHGLPHPPGYPTFSMVGNVFAHTPLLNGLQPEGVSATAWRLNFMSAVCNAAAGLLIYLTVARFGEGDYLPWCLGALMASCGFCFSPLVWAYAVTAEVFAMNNLFVALLLYLSVSFFRRKERLDSVSNVTHACIGAFICGLGLTNQHSLIFFVIPIALFVLFALLRNKTCCQRGTIMLQVGVSFALGLLPYAYMPYATGAPGSWGDATTVHGFLKHILRQEYGTFLLHPDMIGTESSMERTRMYVEHFFSSQVQIYPSKLAAGLVIVGMLQLLFISGLAGVLLLVMLLTYLFTFHALSNLDISSPLTFAVHERFWMQPNACAFVIIGVGSATVSSIVLRFVGRSKIVSSLLRFGMTCAVIGHLGQNAKRNYVAMDQSQNFALDHVLRDTLNSLPKQSLLLLRGDHYTNVMRYLHQVDGVRPDCDLVSDQLVKARWFTLQEQHFPNVSFPTRRYNDFFYGFSLEELITANAVKRPVVACSHLVTVHPQNTYTGLYYGMCDLLVPKTKFPQFTAWWKAVKNLLPTTQNYTRILADNQFGPGTWEYKLYEKMYEKQQKLAADMILYAQSTHPPNKKILKKTRVYIEKFLQQDRGPFVIQGATWKNLAVAWLTSKNAMQKRPALTGGLRALREYLKTPASKEDTQLDYVKTLEKQVASALATMQSGTPA
eukprot:Stramenopile-MAST_4_protein_383